MPSSDRPQRTALFLFADSTHHACECGRVLGGSYVEFDDLCPGAARARMFELRGNRWSHQVNGLIVDLFPALAENPDDIRRTHQRLPANPPGRNSCFCGGLGQPYRWTLAREDEQK